MTMTRDEVKALAEHIVGLAEDSPFAEGRIWQLANSHLALHDAHDAALERVRALGAALDVVTRHWIGRTDAHGIGFDEDGFEQQLMALDRAFAALAAIATPQEQEVGDANG